MERKHLLLAGAGLLALAFVAKPVVAFVQRGRRLTSAPAGADGNVDADPYDLAAAAGDVTGDDVDVEDYALARMIGSEEPDADYATKVAIAWVCVNDSANFGSVLDTVTYSPTAGKKGLFGTQTGRRYSTRLDPYEGDLEIARRVRGGVEPDPTGGAANFFRPGAQDALHARDASKYKSAAQVDASWTAGGKERVGVAGADPGIWFYRRVA